MLFRVIANDLLARFDINFNVKVCVRVMISWVVLYENRKDDPYMPVRVQTVLESNT